MALRSAHPDIPIVLDESDTFPHTLYSRSSKSMHAKLCAGIFSGLRGAKLWLVNMKKLNRPVHKNYTKILGKYNKFYQTLTAEVQKSRFTGVVIPASHNFPKWHSADSGTFENYLPEPVLSTTTFGLLGIPFYCDFDLENKENVYALAGAKAVSRFTDEELKKLLSGKLLVDGPAAAALCERGFSELLGVKAELVDFRYNGERSVSGQPFTCSKSPGVPRFTLLDEKAEVTTSLCYTPFVGAAPEPAAPGTVFYHNAAGGSICCTAFHQEVPYAQNNEPRKEWYIEILDKLNGQKIPAVCQDLQDITALTRRCADGSLLLLVCSLNFDELDEIKIRFAQRPAELSRLTPEGVWEPCKFRIEDENVFIDSRMVCYDLEIFKVK